MEMMMPAIVLYGVNDDLEPVKKIGRAELVEGKLKLSGDTKDFLRLFSYHPDTGTVNVSKLSGKDAEDWLVAQGTRSYGSVIVPYISKDLIGKKADVSRLASDVPAEEEKPVKKYNVPDRLTK